MLARIRLGPARSRLSRRCSGACRKWTHDKVGHAPSRLKGRTHRAKAYCFAYCFDLRSENSPEEMRFGRLAANRAVASSP